MPSGEYAMLRLEGDLVDCNNDSVPLDVVYNHHWLMKPISGPTTHYNGPSRMLRRNMISACLKAC